MVRWKLENAAVVVLKACDWKNSAKTFPLKKRNQISLKGTSAQKF